MAANRLPPLRRSAPATPASVARLRAAVVEHLVAAGVSGIDLDGVKLAVSEAVSNAVLHAYQDVDEPGDVHVSVEVTDAAVQLTVADDGAGMAPRMDSPGAGLGLPIIASVASKLEVAQGDGRGTQLRISFGIARPEAAGA
jgi:serine/threonine-protein kinase RsbW/stage II sporulation protein AB (anti-sigma F factor)